MSKYGEYAIAYFDDIGTLIGYYAEDSHSGGYPYIGKSVQQAVTLTEDRAMKTAEESFTSRCGDFSKIDSCVIGRFTIANGKILSRSTYKEQKKQREIEERMNKILELQREIEQIKEKK